jgi:hypothetical protein
LKYIALIAYGEEDFGKFEIEAFNDEDALKAAKEKAREFDGVVVSVVQGANFEKGRTVLV